MMKWMIISMIKLSSQCFTDTDFGNGDPRPLPGAKREKAFSFFLFFPFFVFGIPLADTLFSDDVGHGDSTCSWSPPFCHHSIQRLSSLFY